MFNFIFNVGLVAIGLYTLRRFLLYKQSLPLPPGPKGLPLVGNVLDIPSGQSWKIFADWRASWGDIISLTIFGRTMIILNSAKLAVDLLDKKGNIYSDRPVLTMANELVGHKHSIPSSSYTDRVRKARRLYHHAIGTRSSMEKWCPLQEQEIFRFLQLTLTDPNNVEAHIQRTLGAIILQMTYGYQVQEDSDPIVHNLKEAVDNFSVLVKPGAFFVDVLPILRYLPEWFPMAGFKKKAKVWGKSLIDLVNVPYNFTQTQLMAGTASVSFVSSNMENAEKDPEETDILKWAAGAFYSAGFDTTAATVYSFFLALTLHPEVVKKAQEEIDSVIGNDRLPTSLDRDQLPYIEAVVNEVLRWNPVGPLGVPHRLREDDTHKGYFIPKDSVIIPNVWMFAHDPRTYANPMEFNPDRFLPMNGREPECDPRTFVFGFGRRICPGLKLADSILFTYCAMTLAVFDVSKAVDESGSIIEPGEEYTSGALCHPKPFRCSIKPRSAKAEALIKMVGLQVPVQTAVPTR